MVTCNQLMCPFPFHLDFSNPFLFNVNESLIDVLKNVQDPRILVCSRRFAHTSLQCKRLHWLSVRQCIKHKIAVLKHYFLNGLAPDYLADLITPCRPPRALSSSESHLLAQPRMRLATCRERSFSFAAPFIWNSLTTNLRCVNTVLRSPSIEH